MDLVKSLFDFKTQLSANPSPWFGGIIGGLLTGGLFGWISHGRSIRPTLVFYRDETDAQPKWRLKNVGLGPALHIRVRDYKGASIVRKVKPYAIEPSESRPLDWVTGGDRLEADYTDVFGRRWYRSVGDNNDTHFEKKCHVFFWTRPPKKAFEGYEPEIHVLRGIKKENKS